MVLGLEMKNYVPVLGGTSIVVALKLQRIRYLCSGSYLHWFSERTVCWVVVVLWWLMGALG